MNLLAFFSVLSFWGQLAAAAAPSAPYFNGSRTLSTSRGSSSVDLTRHVSSHASPSASSVSNWRSESNLSPLPASSSISLSQLSATPIFTLARPERTSQYPVPSASSNERSLIGATSSLSTPWLTGASAAKSWHALPASAAMYTSSIVPRPVHLSISYTSVRPSLSTASFFSLSATSSQFSADISRFSGPSTSKPQAFADGKKSTVSGERSSLSKPSSSRNPITFAIISSSGSLRNDLLSTSRKPRFSEFSKPTTSSEKSNLLVPTSQPVSNTVISRQVSQPANSTLSLTVGASLSVKTKASSVASLIDTLQTASSNAHFTVVSRFTTYCPTATTFVYKDQTATVSTPTTITITDCPCTLTRESVSGRWHLVSQSTRKQVYSTVLQKTRAHYSPQQTKEKSSVVPSKLLFLSASPLQTNGESSHLLTYSSSYSEGTILPSATTHTSSHTKSSVHSSQLSPTPYTLQESDVTTVLVTRSRIVTKTAPIEGSVPSEVSLSKNVYQTTAANVLTTTVSVSTTVCTNPTTFVVKSKTYTVVSQATLTISDCILTRGSPSSHWHLVLDTTSTLMQPITSLGRPTNTEFPKTIGIASTTSSSPSFTVTGSSSTILVGSESSSLELIVTNSASSSSGHTLPTATSSQHTTTKVVDSYTTYCPSPTTFTINSKVYSATGPSTFTITDCPCTLTKLVSSLTSASSLLSKGTQGGTSQTGIPKAQNPGTYTLSSTQVNAPPIVSATSGTTSVASSNVDLITIVSDLRIFCPTATTLTINSKTYTATPRETLTVTDCPCTIPRSLEWSNRISSIGFNVGGSGTRTSRNLESTSSVVPTSVPASSALSPPQETSHESTVVSLFTTFCPGPTTFTINSQVYSATGASTFTITNCPCTLTPTITEQLRTSTASDSLSTESYVLTTGTTRRLTNEASDVSGSAITTKNYYSDTTVIAISSQESSTTSDWKKSMPNPASATPTLQTPVTASLSTTTINSPTTIMAASQTYTISGRSTALTIPDFQGTTQQESAIHSEPPEVSSSSELPQSSPTVPSSSTVAVASTTRGSQPHVSSEGEETNTPTGNLVQGGETTRKVVTRVKTLTRHSSMTSVASSVTPTSPAATSTVGLSNDGASKSFARINLLAPFALLVLF